MQSIFISSLGPRLPDGGQVCARSTLLTAMSLSNGLVAEWLSIIKIAD